MHYRGEEQEQLHPGQNVTQTATTTDTERNEEVRLVNFAFGIQEAAWVELLGAVPQRWVHVDAVDQRHDIRTSWDCVAIDDDITVETRMNTNLEFNQNAPKF